MTAGHGGICSSRAASGAVSLTNGVWFGGRALMKAVVAAGVGRGAPACLKEALGEEKEKDERKLDTSLGHDQKARCRTHISLPGQEHPALHRQLCLVGSWATRRRWGRAEGALFGGEGDEGFWGPQGLLNCRSWRCLDVGPCFCHTCAL